MTRPSLNQLDPSRIAPSPLNIGTCQVDMASDGPGAERSLLTNQISVGGTTANQTRWGSVKLISHWLRSGLMLGALTATTGLAPAVCAGTHCDTYVPSCSDGLCDCGKCDAAQCDAAPSCEKCARAYRRNHSPIYRSFDALAGGIEHVLGLDDCKTGSCGCDAGCDTAPWSGLEPALSAPPLPTPMPEFTTPMAPPRMKPTPAAPPLKAIPGEPRMTQPRIVTPGAVQEPTPVPSPPTETAPSTMTKPRIVPAEPATPNDAIDIPSLELPDVPPADNVIPGKPDPVEQPKKDGSIFDALEDVNDPFEQDAARLRQPYQPIRPTSLRSTDNRSQSRKPSGLRSAGSFQPSFRSVHPASRGIPSQAPGVEQQQPEVIGSGLRTAEKVEPLQQVNHVEPSASSTMGGGRVLAPYRRSR